MGRAGTLAAGARQAAIVDENTALTGLRGIAVALVVLSHLGNGGMDLLPGVRLNAIGKAGVWLFFVLSAYLLTSHLTALLSSRQRPWGREIGRYAINRIFRIFPLFSLVLLAHWAWGDMDVAGVLHHLALVEGMGELWAIPVEFKYYVVIPFVALLAAVGGARLASALVVAALLSSIALCAMWPEEPFSNDLDLVFRLPAFLAGSLIALWPRDRLPGFFNSPVFAALAVAAAVAATYAYRSVILDDRLLAFTPAVAVLLAAVWSAALLAGLRRSGALARMLAVRPLAILGKISFGVYLWHMFPLRFLLENGASGPAATGWLVIAATVALAGLTYLAVERPGILLGRRLGDSLFARAKKESPARR